MLRQMRLGRRAFVAGVVGAASGCGRQSPERSHSPNTRADGPPASASITPPPTSAPAPSPSPSRSDTATWDGGPSFDVRDLSLEGTLSKRATLLVPSQLAPGERVPLVVLLHGLGETNQERAGAYAWLDRYGLGTAYERLRRAPIARTSTRGEWTDARLAEVNASLAERPFRGFAVACPYMPQLPAAQLDPYGKWLVETLLPRVRSEAPVFDDAAHTIFGGCSLGGYASLEIFLRRPESFAAWAGVQTAIGEAGAPGYADRLDAALKKVGPRALYVGTSIGDPYLKANQILGESLAKRGIARELRVSPGPHDQPWLREIGTIELLRWCDLAVPHSP